MIITIDGPATSGKSTLAQELAKKLGFYYLSSGMIFRAIAYLLIHEYHYSKNNLLKISQKDLDNLLAPQNFAYHYDSSTNNITVTFKGKNITPFLKSEQIDEAASLLGENVPVRYILREFQKSLAEGHDAVAEGRDSGTAIFPHAPYKFFLTANLNERAKRWQLLQEKKGKQYSLQEAKEIVNQRDERDKNRAIDPLVIPKNAFIIDNTDMNPQETLEKCESILRENKKEND